MHVRFIFLAMRRVLMAMTGLLFMIMSAAKGQPINWTGSASTDWNTFSNWDAGVVPSSGNDVILDTNSGNQAVFSSGNETIGNLTVGNINGGANTSLSISNGANLTATSLAIGANTGSNGTVTISGANSTLVVDGLALGNLGDGNLVIGDGANMTDIGSFILGVNGTITQTGGMVNLPTVITRRVIVSPGGSGISALILNIQGVYNLLGGDLKSVNGALGTGRLNLGGGTVEINSTADYATNTTLLDDTTSTVNLDLSGLLESIWAGAITGNGNLELTGNGVLLAGGNNTYTGTTTINGGTLAIDGNLTASNVTVNNGGALSGGGNITGLVTVNSGGNLLPGLNSPVGGGRGGAGGGGRSGGGGGGGAAGAIATPSIVFGNSNLDTLTIGALALTSGATSNFYITDPLNYMQLSVTGALSLSGNLVLNLPSSLYVGTYNLFTAGSVYGDFTNVSTRGLGGLYSGTLTENNGVWSENFSGININFTPATGVATVSVNLPPGPTTGFINWMETNFTAAQLLDSTNSGILATPVGDGIPNLMKYAFGISPLNNAYSVNNSSPVLPQPTTDGTNLILTFTESQSDLLYTPEVSTDLVNWSTNGVTVQMNGIQATATYLLPPNGSAFMRVLVSPAP